MGELKITPRGPGDFEPPEVRIAWYRCGGCGSLFNEDQMTGDECPVCNGTNFSKDEPEAL